MSRGGSTDAAGGAHRYPLLACCTSQPLASHAGDKLVLALRARASQIEEGHVSWKGSAQLLTGQWPVQSLPPGVNRVGRMEIGPEILGYGSSGTLVFEGTLDGRPIAVKRILCQVQ